MNRTTLTVGMIAATSWEARGLAGRLGMKEVEPGFYEWEGTAVRIFLSICGMGPKNAEAASLKMISFAPDLLISAGFAGALQEGLRSGDGVLDVGESDVRFVKMMRQVFSVVRIPMHEGKFLCARQVILDRTEKRERGRESGALAVEMESHAVRDVCREKKVAFGSFRVISDTADQSLPALLSAIDSDGKPGCDFWKLLLKRPQEWIPLFRLFISSMKAEKNLLRLLLEFVRTIEKDGFQ